MMADSGTDPVYWDDAYSIALLLIAAHPRLDPAQVDYATLHNWVIHLPGFADDPRIHRPDWLDDIRAEWLEIGGVETWSARRD